MYDTNEKRIYDWIIQTKGEEIIILEGDGMGRALIISGMKVAAKVLFIDELIKANTIEGYAVQIDYSGKQISIIKDSAGA